MTFDEMAWQCISMRLRKFRCTREFKQRFGTATSGGERHAARINVGGDTPRRRQGREQCVEHRNGKAGLRAGQHITCRMRHSINDAACYEKSDEASAAANLQKAYHSRE